MAQFVLVHGAWHGAWCWARVLPLLRAADHVAHAPTLTGVADRAHLLSPDIRLNTHIDDVMKLIKFEELDDVVLVGHSYAGMVITGVANASLKQGSPALQQLVYLDAVAPHAGESWSSHQPPETVAACIRAAVVHKGTKVLLPPDAKVFGLEGADHEWVTRRMTPQPFALYQDTLSFDAGRLSALPRTFIDCTSPSLPTLAEIRSRVQQEKGWWFLELEMGHDAMVSAPGELADALLSLIHKSTGPATLNQD
ncbi:MAG: alpha/beta hydrolase [Gammaproteobacteria bacterium]|nr:alpha/beta hydrolase [Gammaproteobacteria bacterium]